MRLIALAVTVLVLLLVMTPVSAQTTFTQGYYDFESTIASMTYNGSWSTGAASNVGYRQTLSGVSNVSFAVTGKTLIVWRLMRNSVGNSMQVCVNYTGCQTIAADTGGITQYWYPFVLTLPSGINIVTISWVSGGVNLDSFMVLSDPSLASGMPTAVPTVPTATILPSSTPAYTATPGPTPVSTATAVPTSTPAPTATPYTLPDVVFAVEPDAEYRDLNGQIVAISYRVTAGDMAIITFLGLLTLLGFALMALKMGER